ncbi:biotin transporter BioY [Anaerovorax odorimutans]|uniref:biotin transporter BioY n=1 Tax=Anaerovorax odorimutans TaxID=109327 RepID=UPI0004202170|nr:biotin transporter BioY [Anaerovorax odorimutans]
MQTSTKSNIRTFPIILCALFAALTAVCSAISIPIPFTPIPINLATLSIFLAGGLLGAKWGTISQVVYVLLGAIGLPVFHNFTGGFGIIAGPTGGYIVGYIAAAFLIGYLTDKFIFSKDNKTSAIYVKLILSMVAGGILCYTLGTIWFMKLTGTSLIPALLSCVIPFLPGDLIKILIASFLTKRLKNFL